MRYSALYVFAILFSFVAKGQGKFEIKLNAPLNINDSLIFAAPDVVYGFEEFYNFNLQTNNEIKDLRILTGWPYSAYSLKIKKENLLSGELDYPKPVSFIYFNSKVECVPCVTTIFFIENGNYEIHLPKVSNKLEVNIDSPANNEYRELKRQLAPVYVKSDRHDTVDSLVNFEEKQKILSSYITKNPNSYIALWQIIEDYDLHHDNANYAENLPLFSDEVKNSKLFKSFESKIKQESTTREGNIMPDISFDNQHSLTKKDFGQYKLTFIDYWATTCGPCIKAMPRMVDLFNEFQDKGLNIISITDENTSEKIEFANQILKKNKAQWTNFFDVNGNFKTAVHASGYPLQFLVDSDGKILVRVYGDLNEIRNAIKKHLN